MYTIDDKSPNNREDVEIVKELNYIQFAKDELKTPNRTLSRRVESIVESAVETQPSVLPKRPKLVQFKDQI